jgi:cytochrome c553
MKVMQKITLVTSLLSACLLSNQAWAGDAEAGKAKSMTCSACHGGNGISQIPMYPNLAGQKEQYLILQLKAFRDGQRKNMVMAPMAAALSDADIDNLSAYYAGLNPAG